MEMNSFPRGKGKSTYNYTRKRLEEEQETDNPFATTSKKSRFDEETDKDPTTTLSTKSQRRKLLQGGIYTNNKNQIIINSIKFKDYKDGMKVLATIRDIQDNYIIVSLPNLLMGYYHRGDKEEDEDCEVTSLKTLCKYLPKMCAVSISSTTTLDQQRKIEVSFDPHQVNAGVTYDALHDGMILRSRIVSEEDYGYVVDVGLLGVVSFLKTNDGALDVGSLLDLQISKLEDNRITLQLPSGDDEHKEVEKEFHTKYESIHTLLPGNLIRFHVEEYCTNGLLVGFGGNDIFQGAIEVSQLLLPEQQEDWKKNWNMYRKGVERLRARIICIDSDSKTLRLSVLPHVLSLSPPAEMKSLPRSLDVGSILKDVKIVRLDRGFGVLAIYPLDSATQQDDTEKDDDTASSSVDDAMEVEHEGIADFDLEDGFGDAFSSDTAPKKKKKQSILTTHAASKYASIYVIFPKKDDTATADSHDANNKYTVGTKLAEVRVVSTKKWMMDNYIEGSIDPTILTASVFSYDNLKPGSTYSCTISKIQINTAVNDIKISVTLGPKIRCIITSRHFFDKGALSSYKVSAIQKKYKEGMVIQAKFLGCDDFEIYYMTLKPSLLKQDFSKSNQFIEYDDLQINDVGMGYVTKKDPLKGIHVMFYNKIHGIVPLHECVFALGEDWSKIYDLGDAVKCRMTKLHTFHNADGEDESHRLGLSFNLSPTISTEEGAEDVLLPVGTVIEEDVMKVYEITPKEIKVAMKQNKVDTISSSDDKKIIQGVIPLTQINEKYMKDMNVLDKYPIGKRIQCKGVILHYEQMTEDSNIPIISLRPSFIAAITSKDKNKNAMMLPSSNAQVSKGSSIIGYVHTVDERYGTFCKFLNNMTGLIPKKNATPNMELYSTIHCKVTTIDTDLDRLCLKPISSDSSGPRFKKGDLVKVMTTSVSDHEIHVVTVDGGIEGIIPALEVSTDLNIVQNLTKHFSTIGKVVQARVLLHNRSTNYKQLFRGGANQNKKEDTSNTSLYLSILSAEEAKEETTTTTIKLPKVGDVVIGRINRRMRNTCRTSILLEVRSGCYPTFCYVRVCVTELMDKENWMDEPLGKFNDQYKYDFGKFPDQTYVYVKITSYSMSMRDPKSLGNPSPLHLAGTLRPSLLSNNSENPSTSIPKIGDSIKGYVSQNTSTECILRISNSIVGRVIPGKPVFPVGRLVCGIVMDVCDMMNGDIGVQLDTTAVVAK